MGGKFLYRNRIVLECIETLGNHGLFLFPDGSKIVFGMTGIRTWID